MAATSDLRSEYFQVLLRHRRNLQAPLSVEQGCPVKDPLYQGNGPLGSREVMESCPRKEVENFKEKLVEENFYLITESGEQGRVPVLLLRLNDTVPRRKPVIVLLHSSYKCKEWLRPLLEAYASRGYISVAIDSRYHGERASNKTTYIDALKSAWRNGDTMPFIFDTVWDLMKLGDHLSAREDADPSRIGITGESLVARLVPGSRHPGSCFPGSRQPGQGETKTNFVSARPGVYVLFACSQPGRSTCLSNQTR